MKAHALVTPFCALVACASISGSQSFETSRQFTLPSVEAIAGDTDSHTIDAIGGVDDMSFAESLLNDLDQLLERDHIDSADAKVRILSARLSTDTTFAGITAVRVQLVTATETIQLCSRTLRADDQKASSITCGADHVIDTATLQQSAASTAPPQIEAQLDVSGTVTARKLDSTVTFEVEVDVEASL